MNNTFALSLPRTYDISYVIYPRVSSNSTGEKSTLQILALGKTNNSQVQCAIDIDGKIETYSQPAFLQGNVYSNLMAIETGSSCNAYFVSVYPCII